MKIGIRGLRKTLWHPGIALGILLAVTLACYTPWEKTWAEKKVVAQFADLDETIYVPPDATLLAETYFSAQSHEYALAGANRIYTIPRPCEEIVAEYKQAMADSGWTAMPMGDCNGAVWLDMRAADGAHFGIDAKPGEKSRLAEEWQILQEQYDGLYYVMASTYVWYEKQ